jgi:hypothetical protein
MRNQFDIPQTHNFTALICSAKEVSATRLHQQITKLFSIEYVLSNFQGGLSETPISVGGYAARTLGVRITLKHLFLTKA